LLPLNQELALVDWVGLCAITAKPFDLTGIQSMAYELSGSVPGINWHLKFQACHPEVLTSKPSGRDPKQAQNFNPTNIKNYFELLRTTYTDFPNIPPQHIWNMDKKGHTVGWGAQAIK